MSHDIIPDFILTQIVSVNNFSQTCEIKVNRTAAKDPKQSANLT